MTAKVILGLLVMLFIGGCAREATVTTSTTTTTSTTSTSSTTSTTTTLIPGTVVIDPPIEAGLPDGAPDIAVMVEQDQFGVVGPGEQIWWWTAFDRDEPRYLGGYDTLTVAPDRTMWVTRNQIQTEACAPLVVDVANFTGPDASSVMFEIPSVNQPNCRPDEVRWPAGYLRDVAASELGLALLFQDQFPREGCDLISCIPDKVVFVELRPFDALDQIGTQVQVYRQPLNIDDRDAEAQALIPFPGAVINGESLDGTVISLSFDDGTGGLFDLATLDLSPAPQHAIPTHDGAGYLYSRVEGTFPEFSSTLVEGRPGSEERDVFTVNFRGIFVYADTPDWVVLGLVTDEQNQLMVYDKAGQRLHFTGIQGLPGPQLARVMPAR